MESKAGFFRGSIGVLQLDDDDDSKSSHAQVFPWDWNVYLHLTINL